MIKNMYLYVMGNNIIYGLRCPKTDDYRYIGKSSCGVSRPKSHFIKSHNDGVNMWVSELRENGLLPIIDILETCDSEGDLLIRERWWINYYIEIGCDLLNIFTYKSYSNQDLKHLIEKERRELEVELDKIKNKKNKIPVSETIGEAIKNRRKVLGITQPHLAELAGISTNTLYKIERGQANPTLDILKKIASVIGIEIIAIIKDNS